jgi:integrase
VPERLPVVLSRAEVAALLGELSGDVGLQARLLYGCGIRRMECLRLRIQDLRFERHEIVVRGGKGNEDQITLLPPELRPSLREQVEEARRIHQADCRAGFGRLAPCCRAPVSEWRASLGKADPVAPQCRRVP